MLTFLSMNTKQTPNMRHYVFFVTFTVFVTPILCSITRKKEAVHFSSNVELSSLSFASEPEVTITAANQLSFLGSRVRPAPSCRSIFQESPFLSSGLYWLQKDDEVKLNYCQSYSYGRELNPAQSCRELNALGVPSGLYYVKAKESDESIPVFCDHETDGGGWTLLFKIEQNEASTLNVSEDDYQEHFYSASWIRGSMKPPLSPKLEANSGSVFFGSQNWGNFLSKDSNYELRQQIVHVNDDLHIDVAFNFTHPGFLRQDDVAVDTERAWLLGPPKTIRNDYAGAYSFTNEGTMYFWPPFSPAAVNTGRVYSGCETY
eukprot:GCRY01004361.1.p1 GENE.GCRY01004361.1~~GCRY01004361.1.p1  ORF type:complete len:317 (-),score=19.76 GCRY01004361.1:445-1395(-)